MSRQDQRQGRTLPPVRVSAVGKRVARVRHWFRDHWDVMQYVIGIPLSLVLMYVTALTVINAAPLNR